MPISGLRYIPDYLDQPTHDRLLAHVDSHRWLMSVDHGVQIYGYTYSHHERAALPIGPLPDWGHVLALRLVRDGLLPQVADQMVANEYHPGAGLFSHIDQAVFGDIIAAVSLGSTCVMEFSSVETNAAVEILLEPRSVLVLSGPARWAWRHGIPARLADAWQNRELPRSRRVSLTFRIVPRAAGVIS